MAAGIKKTNEEFLNEIQQMYHGQYRPIDIYINDSTKIQIECCLCGSVFSTKPNNILHGHGCPKCSRELLLKRRRENNRQHFEQTMQEKFADKFEILGDYTDAHTQILVRHIQCGTEFMVTPGRFMQSNALVACPKCGATHRKNTEEFIQQMAQMYGDEFTVLGEYVNQRTKILIKHNQCERVFSTTPNILLTGHGCPLCCQSRGEKTIQSFLEQHHINFIRQHWFSDCRNLEPLKFDFFLPELRKAIEFDGEQHFIAKPFFGGTEGLKNTQMRDKIKNQYCEDHDIALLRIAFNENIEEKLQQFLYIIEEG